MHFDPADCLCQFRAAVTAPAETDTETDTDTDGPAARPEPGDGDSTDDDDDYYLIAVPKQEVEASDLTPGDTYQVGVFADTDVPAGAEPAGQSPASRPSSAPPHQASQPLADRATTRVTDSYSAPPVVEGETRNLEIEAIGDQGDGIAKVERGYVVIVPNTAVGDRVKVTVTTVNQNYAMGEVVKHLSSAPRPSDGDTQSDASSASAATGEAAPAATSDDDA